MRTLAPFILLAVLLLGTSCRRQQPIELEASKPVNIDQNLMQANKYMQQSEETQIAQYLERRGWQTQRMDCGIRLQEYVAGHGNCLTYDDEAVIRYRLEGIDGKPFYTNCCDTVTVGRHKPNIGVDVALMHLRHGSKARIIVPSAQGYGVVGDGQYIPTRAILIYDLEVI